MPWWKGLPRKPLQSVFRVLETDHPAAPAASLPVFQTTVQEREPEAAPEVMVVQAVTLCPPPPPLSPPGRSSYPVPLPPVTLKQCFSHFPWAECPTSSLEIRSPAPAEFLQARIAPVRSARLDSTVPGRGWHFSLAPGLSQALCESFG